MREIKFRAKRQDNGEWIKSGTLVSLHSGDTTDFFLPKSPSHCHAWADQDGNLTAMESSYYRKSDIREFDGHGKLTDVYTGVYGDGRKGAKAFKHKAMALEVMRMIDGDSVEEVFAEVDDDADESRA